ncbi:unnamed protein product [Polarella glacialis]|uniref:Uncharacterized protein n=1 Tax=Polarella glacialis TaxID=89957 RepID=A0A813HB65_POLGL|nr:unnamed protein product [Polarella glacialis]
MSLRWLYLEAFFQTDDLKDGWRSSFGKGSSQPRVRSVFGLSHSSAASSSDAGTRALSLPIGADPHSAAVESGGGRADSHPDAATRAVGEQGLTPSDGGWQGRVAESRPEPGHSWQWSSDDPSQDHFWYPEGRHGGALNEDMEIDAPNPIGLLEELPSVEAAGLKTELKDTSCTLQKPQAVWKTGKWWKPIEKSAANTRATDAVPGATVVLHPNPTAHDSPEEQAKTSGESTRADTLPPIASDLNAGDPSCAAVSLKTPPDGDSASACQQDPCLLVTDATVASKATECNDASAHSGVEDAGKAETSGTDEVNAIMPPAKPSGLETIENKQTSHEPAPLDVKPEQKPASESQTLEEKQTQHETAKEEPCSELEAPEVKQLVQATTAPAVTELEKCPQLLDGASAVAGSSDTAPAPVVPYKPVPETEPVEVLMPVEALLGKIEQVVAARSMEGRENGSQIRVAIRSDGELEELPLPQLPWSQDFAPTVLRNGPSHEVLGVDAPTSVEAPSTVEAATIKMSGETVRPDGSVRLRVFDGKDELPGMSLSLPCTVFGSALKSAHVADGTHPSVKSTHAAIVFVAPDKFMVQPIHGEVHMTCASSHTVILNALLRERRTAPRTRTPGKFLGVGGPPEAVTMQRCCFKLGKSNITYFVDVLPSLAKVQALGTARHLMHAFIDGRKTSDVFHAGGTTRRRPVPVPPAEEKALPTAAGIGADKPAVPQPAEPKPAVPKPLVLQPAVQTAVAARRPGLPRGPAPWLWIVSGPALRRDGGPGALSWELLEAAGRPACGGTTECSAPEAGQAPQAGLGSENPASLNFRAGLKGDRRNPTDDPDLGGVLATSSGRVQKASSRRAQSPLTPKSKRSSRKAAKSKRRKVKRRGAEASEARQRRKTKETKPSRRKRAAADAQKQEEQDQEQEEEEEQDQEEEAEEESEEENMDDAQETIGDHQEEAEEEGDFEEDAEGEEEGDQEEGDVVLEVPALPKHRLRLVKSEPEFLCSSSSEAEQDVHPKSQRRVVLPAPGSGGLDHSPREPEEHASERLAARADEPSSGSRSGSGKRGRSCSPTFRAHHRAIAITETAMPTCVRALAKQRVRPANRIGGATAIRPVRFSIAPLVVLD